MVFLHGLLTLKIIKAKDLPNVDENWFSKLRNKKDMSDPYVTVDTISNGVREDRIAKTPVVWDCLDPKWDSNYKIEMCHEIDSFLVQVKDMDMLTKNDFMGSVSIPVADLLSEKPLQDWFKLSMGNNKKAGQIYLDVHFQSIATLTSTNEVSNCVFPMREGCDVTLYQDAHNPAISPVSDVPGPDGEQYTPGNYFIEVAAAIRAARKFIYVCGWSVSTEISLERHEGAETIGQMLKSKADDEGVRVLVMVWNEALSTETYPVGMMGTHDEDTRNYFANTSVEVVLARREKPQSDVRHKGFVGSFKLTKGHELAFVKTCFTHHQKCVLLDCEIEGESRRGLLGYVGGLDLTDGRYDTPAHPLYKTLVTAEHKDDYYNGTCKSSVGVGPRQPWHDIHARVQGNIVKDLIQNFTERWRKHAQHLEQKLLHMSSNEFVLDWQSRHENAWNAQFFRSINNDSACFNSETLCKFQTRKERLYENTIQRAYIHHIRRARKFIYIENQYFLGSSHSWSTAQEAKANNLIPIELTIRVCNAIKARENFRVYIVLPIHPEGDPTSAAVQEILFWQFRTMQMMYKRIASAIVQEGINAQATDYLTFFCLTKRECEDDVPEGLQTPDVKTQAVAASVRDHLRFMIYVHSKMAIFDDEYIIVGSANINERSMNGNRDSEMAVGLFQPKFTKESFGGANVEGGSVATFRLGLWAEHVGEHAGIHLQPETRSCMDHMREIGEENLQAYIGGERAHSDSHLTLYPLFINAVGEVMTIQGTETFPDCGGSITGSKSMFLPNTLTT